jgi:P27 family predicted phage terminase small subunit
VTGEGFGRASKVIVARARGGANVRNPTTPFVTDIRSEQPKPPAHLTRQAKRWWRSVLDAYDLEPHDLAILTAAAEALDRKEEARLIIAVEGIVLRLADGSSTPHPAVAVEDLAAMRFAHLVREIGLDATSGSEVRLP